MTSRFNASEQDAVLILVNQQGIIPYPDDDVNITTAKRALCNELASIIPMASSVSEGGYSVTWNMEAVKMYYSALCEELGIASVLKPRIRNRSNLW